MYYRGSGAGKRDAEGNNVEIDQYFCYLESIDGIKFTRPNLKKCSFKGSFDNNIIEDGKNTHNFAPFKDNNPNRKDKYLYKALTTSGIKGDYGLDAYGSQDGISWEKIHENHVITDGAFDSLNIAFYDNNKKMYRCFSRYFDDGKGNSVRNTDNEIRAIQSCESKDFINWTKPIFNKYQDGVLEQFYTNAATLCPDNPGILFAFPKRFDRSRKKLEKHSATGVSDAAFMSSRDGVNWYVFREAWVRPGLDALNWTDRSQMVAAGIIDRGNHYDLYISEHFRTDSNRLRRVEVERNRFSSLHADHNGGYVISKPMIFKGEDLYLNYSTSAMGGIKVSIIEPETQEEIVNLGFSDMEEIYGDSLDEKVVWKNEGLLKRIQGKAICIKFHLRDADIYSIQFR